MLTIVFKKKKMKEKCKKWSKRIQILQSLRHKTCHSTLPVLVDAIYLCLKLYFKLEFGVL